MQTEHPMGNPKLVQWAPKIKREYGTGHRKLPQMGLRKEDQRESTRTENMTHQTGSLKVHFVQME